jgi:ankyrin repeat protein
MSNLWPCDPFVSASLKYGFTALMYACGDGHLQTVLELIAQQADLNAVGDVRICLFVNCFCSK